MGLKIGSSERSLSLYLFTTYLTWHFYRLPLVLPLHHLPLAKPSMGLKIGSSERSLLLYLFTTNLTWHLNR
jgi:hypothetical protein